MAGLVLGTWLRLELLSFLQSSSKTVVQNVAQLIMENSITSSAHRVPV